MERLFTKKELIEYSLILTLSEYELDDEMKGRLIKRISLLPFKKILKAFKNKGGEVKQINPYFYSIQLNSEYKDLLNNIKVKNFNSIHNKSKEYGYYALPIGD